MDLVHNTAVLSTGVLFLAVLLHLPGVPVLGLASTWAAATGRVTGWTAVGLVAFGLGSAALVVDVVLALTATLVPGWVYLTAAGVVAAVSFAVLHRSPPGSRIVCSAGLLLLLLGLQGAPLAERKAFIRDLDRLEAGTPRAEVARIFSGYQRGHPYGIFPETPTKEIYRPGGSITSYDHVMVHYEGDRVSLVEVHWD